MRNLFLAALALVSAYYSAIYSQAQANILRYPAVAFEAAPWDARVQARYARSLLVQGKGQGQLERAAGLARDALRRDPLLIDAAVTLGTVAQAKGSTSAARRYFAYADRLSRRDLQAHIWAIENAVSRNDVEQAVWRYDLALRSSRDAPALLFPVLTEALAEPAVRSALVSRLKTKPTWGPSFTFYAAGNALHPTSTAAFFDEMRKSGMEPSNAASAVLIDSLILRGSVEQAWSLYASMHAHSDLDRGRLRDPQFSAELESRSLFDWQLFSDNGIETSIDQGDRGRVFTFATGAGNGGLMLRQLELLAPGAYILTWKAKVAEASPSELPYWQLSCIDGRELGRIPLANGAGGAGLRQSRIDVPADCKAQYLSLIARAAIGGPGIDGEVELVQLSPAASVERPETERRN